MNQMRVPFLSLAFFMLFLVSCKQAVKHDENKIAAPPAAPIAQPESNLGKEGTADLMSLVTAYYELKEALVASNADKAEAAGSRVMSAAETMNYHLQQNKALYKTIHPSLDTVMTQSEMVVNAKEKNIEKKRAPFEKISDALYTILRQSHLQHGSVYRAYCPMAFDSKGAYWLSHESEIRNPYFGKKMLECGEVQDSL